MDDFNDIEGIENDIKEEENTNNEDNNVDRDETKRLIEGLQDQLNLQNNEITNLKGEKKELVDNFSKAVGFIEGSGSGKYDPDTGSIIKTAQENVIDQELEALNNTEKEINDSIRELKKQQKNGDISREEYALKYQDEILPLKEQFNDKKYDYKLNKALADKIKDQPKPEPKPKTEPTVDNADKTRIDALTNDYPDISDESTPLFKKMEEIYSRNKNLYSDPNNNYDQYKDLIDRAVVELKADGVEVKNQKNIIRNKFQQPPNRGYDPNTEPKMHITKEQTQNLVSQGYKNKSLLNYVNTSMKQYSETGAIVIDDI